MEKNYFEIISENVSENINNSGFKCSKSLDEYLFTKENINYKIVYKKENQMVCLEKTDGAGSFKTVSSWLIKDTDFSQKDVEIVCHDFVQTIIGTEKKTNKQVRSNKSEEDSNVDCLFFANRMAGIFPELKEDVRMEKECYSKFRGVKFTKEKLMPRVNELLSSGKNKAKVQKFFKVISELYESGTLDVRSIITMVILNSIDDERQIKIVELMISEKLQKAWNEGIKYKNKKVKPEKVKKRSSFISKTLANS